MAERIAEDTLTLRQHKALSALLSEPGIGKAAVASGVPERTLRSWMRQPAFDEAYRVARRDATQQSVARLQQYTSKAADRLEYLLTHGTPAVQLGAARTIFEFAVKAIELDDIAARLAALEAAYAEKL